MTFIIRSIFTIFMADTRDKKEREVQLQALVLAMRATVIIEAMTATMGGWGACRYFGWIHCGFLIQHFIEFKQSSGKHTYSL